MYDKKRRRFNAVLPVLAGLGLASLAIGGGQAGSAEAPLRCEILANAENGKITLEPTVHTDIEARGSYRFRVVGAASSGSTNIQQGGSFSVIPGGSATLGRVMLGDAGAIYDASLEITSSGTTVKCSERVGGAI